jgi:hypothetical protein
MEQYTSSILYEYGDQNNYQRDFMNLKDILNRQGTLFLTDMIAEYIGKSSWKYNFSHEESLNLLESIVNDLREATYERI